MNLPSDFGYCVDWEAENFEVAFEEHDVSGNNELESAEWTELCLKLQDANYKPVPTPPTP